MTTSDHTTSVIQELLISTREVLADTHRVERVIHCAGMSLVMEAIECESGSRVALRLPGPRCWHATTNSGFLDAVRRAALVSSERAERPTDIGTPDLPIIMTPFLEGTDLETRLESAGGLGILEAVDVAIQACEAMADVHAAGVVHCDLRPQKLFVSARDGAPFVTVLMSMISVLRSPDYQTREGRDVDSRTDIYSLGMTLCALLAGKPPIWESTHTSPSGRRTDVREYIPLSITRPELSTELTSTIERAISQRRDDRYESMVSFALALAPFAPPRSEDVLRRIVIKAAARRGAGSMGEGGPASR